MSKSPAFQFYPKDHIGCGAVQSMTEAEEGRYLRLQCFCWEDGSIPSDPAEILKLLKDQTTPVPKVILDRFKPKRGDPSRLIHPGLEDARKKQKMWREKSAKGGVASGEARREARKANADKEKQGRRVDQEWFGEGSTKPEPNPNSSSSTAFASSSSGTTALSPSGAVERAREREPAPERAERDRLVERILENYPDPMDYPGRRDAGAATPLLEAMPMDDLRRIERVMWIWVECEEWHRDKGRWTPKLSNWITGGGWKRLPTGESSDLQDPKVVSMTG